MSATSSSAPDDSYLFSKESRSGTVIIVSAVLTGLSTVVVLLRLYTRQFILKTAGADDWTMGLAQLLSIAAGISTILGTLSTENLVKTLQCLFGAIFSYNFGMNLIKASFLLQYRRIFPSHGLRVVCFWGLVFVGVWTAIQGKVLIAIFGLGFFVCIVSIIRIPTLRAASMATDPTWNNIMAALWTLTELNVAILCSSLPVLRPLVFKSSGRGSKRTITGDRAKNPSKQNSKGDALELTTTSRRKTVKSVISGPNESSDELVHSIDEMIYGTGDSGSRPGAGYNTAALTDDNAAELGQAQAVKTLELQR
ncbi:putative integral membrane protein [Diaporthe ampelina]|uniref:Putative integral membrane protein n=1 Tax=Diaporthe ampelina TaxID=1214573 RepID=A0A0G2FUE7_9PEZI|nr:putative integral membrane protein [Diaporthe ampelina]